LTERFNAELVTFNLRNRNIIWFKKKMPINWVIFIDGKQDKLNTRIGGLEAENWQQDEEIIHLTSRISILESLLSPKLSYATNQSSNKNDGPTPRASTPPSSCEELTGYPNYVGLDGIHLVQNKVTKKIEAVFCQFSTRPGKTCISFLLALIVTSFLHLFFCVEVLFLG